MKAQEIKERAERWMREPYDENTRKEVGKMMQNEEALMDAFYKDLDFGTGGLRGLLGVGTYRMNIYTVGMATQGFAQYLARACAKETWAQRVAISYDVRHGSACFALEAAKIFAANGFEVYLFTGMRPTPLLSFAVRYKGCCGGVMITASHNPKEYNGYKAYGADGGQLVAPHDQNVMEEVRKITDYTMVKREGREELIHYVDAEIEEAYLNRLSALQGKHVPEEMKKEVKMVYTPLHGTGMTMIPKALRTWGYENWVAVPEQMWPDGDFPYAISPNPEEKKTMQAALELGQKVKADVVIATDPDADRIGLGVPDENGNYVLLNGNQTAALLTDYLIRREVGSSQTKEARYIVKTIVTTELLADMARQNGIHCYDVLTGFKYIAEILQKEEGKSRFIGGGEESYGYLAADFVRDKDAVMTACIVAEMVADAKARKSSLCETLEQMYRKYGVYREGLVSLTKKGISGSEEIQKMMCSFRQNPPKEIGGSVVEEIRDYAPGYHGMPPSDVIQFFTKDGSKITVRPSGTEPKIKFYFGVKNAWIEGKSAKEQEEILEQKIEGLKKSLSL